MTRRSLPVTVLTGFLGAGKTTLLNALLSRADLERTAVVINEFGAIGIDQHLLVDVALGDMLVLTTGCLCCASRGDLPAALQRLIDRRADGTIAVDRVIVETTGLADPGPILDILAADPLMLEACRPGGIVTLVDASAGTDLLDTREEAQRQVALADAIVLSKTDLLSDDGPVRGADLLARLAALNPFAPVLSSGDLDAVTAVLVQPERIPVSTRPRRPAAHRHPHAGTRAVCLLAGPVDPGRFEAFVDRLIARHGPSLLRIKGLVASTADPSRPFVVQAVGSRLFPAGRLPDWPTPNPETRLVVILGGGAPEAVVDLWAAYFGAPAIDRPDAEALATSAPVRSGLF